MFPFIIGIVIFSIVSVSCYFIFRNKKTTTKPPPNPPNPPNPTNCDCKSDSDCENSYKCINSKCVLDCPNNCNKIDKCSGETCICNPETFKCNDLTNYICVPDETGQGFASCQNTTCCPLNMITSSDQKCYYYNPAQPNGSPTFNYTTPQTQYETACFDQNLLQETTTNIPFNTYYCEANDLNGQGSQVCTNNNLTGYNSGTYVKCTNPNGCNITNIWNDTGVFQNSYGYCSSVSQK